MADQQHPITPPPELVEQLRNDAPHGIRDAGVTRERQLAIAAYRAGADAEHEATCELLDINGCSSKWIDMLRTARRPKPPSLAEEALDALRSMRIDPVILNGIIVNEHLIDQYNIMHRALKRLQELENNG